MCPKHKYNVSLTTKGNNSMFRKLIFTTVLIITFVASWNYFSLQRNISEIIKSDSRNDGISVFVHYEWFINPNVLVFDLRNVTSSKRPVDVSRVLLQSSEKLKENSYNHVILSFEGKSRFILKGDFFKITGNEYATQNPIYTLRTLPQNVYHLSGKKAFSTWSGGVIGVMRKQMEDLTEFHRQWYATSAFILK